LEDLIFVSLEYDRLILPDLFRSESLFNIHFSLLPAYKGAYTSMWPILDGKDHTGVTLHRIDAGIDTGDIIDQTVIPISPDENSSQVYRKYLESGLTLFAKWISKLVSGTFESTPQPAAGSTFHSRTSIDFDRLEVDLKQTAASIHNQIRAFSFREYQLPVVNCFRISQSEILPSKSGAKPGTVIEEDETSLTIATIDFDVCLRKDPFALLLAACQSGGEQAVSDLARRVDSLEERSPEGWTPLIVAAFHGNFRAVESLLGLGASINNPNYKGTSPLMYAMSPAAENGNFDCLHLLIGSGADLNACDNTGQSALDYAISRKWDEVAAILIENGARESSAAENDVP
jgi:methionyl-tRNA formyltransferase